MDCDCDNADSMWRVFWVKIWGPPVYVVFWMAHRYVKHCLRDPFATTLNPKRNKLEYMNKTYLHLVVSWCSTFSGGNCLRRTSIRRRLPRRREYGHAIVSWPAVLQGFGVAICPCLYLLPPLRRSHLAVTTKQIWRDMSKYTRGHFGIPALRLSGGLRGAHSTWLHLFASLRLLYKYVVMIEMRTHLSRPPCSNCLNFGFSKSPDLMWHVKIDTNSSHTVNTLQVVITKWHIGRTPVKICEIKNLRSAPTANLLKGFVSLFQLRLLTH